MTEIQVNRFDEPKSSHDDIHGYGNTIDKEKKGLLFVESSVSQRAPYLKNSTGSAHDVDHRTADEQCGPNESRIKKEIDVTAMGRFGFNGRVCARTKSVSDPWP